MDLTAWQRICNRLLGPFVKKRARNDKELSANLVKGSMGMMPEVYLSTVIVTSIAMPAPVLGGGRLSDAGAKRSEGGAPSESDI